MSDTPAANQAMNQMFLAAARRGQRFTGAVARLADNPTVDTSPRQERLSALEAAREEAKRSGDDTMLAIAEDQIDRLLDESRAARTRGRRSLPSEGS